MNQPELVEFGIQNEGSDLRAHVCVLARKVYVYPTIYGVEAINTGRYIPRTATQPGVSIQTAKGYAVPWRDIRQCLPISADNVIEAMNFDERDSTSAKGEKAAQVVERLLRKGWFPLPAQPQMAKSLSLQRSGVDIIISGNWRIQVKCDYRGGEPKPPCTGNLFLQTHELNPLKAY